MCRKGVRYFDQELEYPYIQHLFVFENSEHKFKSLPRAFSSRLHCPWFSNSRPSPSKAKSHVWPETWLSSHFIPNACLCLLRLGSDNECHRVQTRFRHVALKLAMRTVNKGRYHRREENQKEHSIRERGLRDNLGMFRCQDRGGIHSYRLM